MSAEGECGHAEYLDRAKLLRDTAAQAHDPRVVEALISSAEAYERMATWLAEAGPVDTTRGAP